MGRDHLEKLSKQRLVWYILLKKKTAIQSKTEHF